MNNILVGFDESSKLNLEELFRDAKSNYGSNCVQFFALNPKNIRAKMKDFTGLNQVKNMIDSGDYFGCTHSQYAYNFCRAVVPQVVGNISSEIHLNEKFGGAGTVVHLGSSPDSDVLEKVYSNLRLVIDKIVDCNRSKFIIESQPGNGNKITRDIDGLIEIWNLLTKRLTNLELKRIGFCLDTCHLYVTDNQFPQKAIHEFSKFEQSIGLDNLTLFHLNDAKSKTRDMHEDLFVGYWDTECLIDVIKYAGSKRIPMVIERHANYKPEQINLVRDLVGCDKKDCLTLVNNYKKNRNES